MGRAPRIVLTTIGSLGDLHPSLAVGLALRARGCDVIVAAAEEYRSNVESIGLRFHPVRVSLRQARQDADLTQTKFLKKAIPDTFTFIVDNLVAAYFAESFEELSKALTGADLVITSTFSVAARLAAVRMSLPSVTLLLYPSIFIPRDECASVEPRWHRLFRRGPGRMALRLMRRLAALNSLSKKQNIVRVCEQLGLAPPASDEWISVPERVFCIYSPCLGAVPPPFAERCEIAGFPFFDGDPGTHALDAALARFLAEAPAPLVFTLGSVLSPLGRQFYDHAIETARRLHMRAVLMVGEEFPPELVRPPSQDIITVRYAPFSLVFPHAAAVIHHGGIGTVAQALRAGVPQLVCPIWGDQADNAERLVRLGVARRLDFNRFTAKRAVDELTELLGEEPRQKAATLSNLVSREDGASVVADWVIARLKQKAADRQAVDG